MSRITEYKGADFVLYAHPDWYRPIKAVRLFLFLAAIIARKSGINPLAINIRQLHKHFPDFAGVIGLTEEPGFQHYLPDHNGKEGECLAVRLYERAYPDDDQTNTIAYMYYFPFKGEVDEEMLQEIKEMITDLRLRGPVAHLDIILNEARAVLGHMLSLMIAPVKI